MKFSFRSHKRLIMAIVIGLLARIVFEFALPERFRTLMAWDVTVIAYIVSVFMAASLENTPARLRRMAVIEDESRGVILTIVCGVAISSLFAIGTLLSDLKNLSPAALDIHLVLAVLTIFLSWSMTHVVLAGHYAHYYYDDPDDVENSTGTEGKPRGGLEFPGGNSPTLWDFLYYSFVVGMTFQVSDVQITDPKLRRLTLFHGILSFLFNTIILAISVNVAAGIIT